LCGGVEPNPARSTPLRILKSPGVGLIVWRARQQR
ncbi:unnamed protein product, partial [Brassica rapa subsp. trilocularis]